MKEPLHGCAFNGAVNTAVQMEDAVTVAHGPKSCAHISYQTITSIGRKSFFERGVLIPVQISPSLISSEMNEGVMVFGGLEELKEKILKLKKYKPAAVFVVTTCPSGIIGEDINVVQNIDMDGIPVIPINTDGNITGDYLQGIITSYIEIAKSLIKINIEKEDNTVNIVAEKPIASSTDKNYNIIKNLLNELGIKINCRFLCNSSVKDVKNFLKAEANILAYEDYMGRTIKQFLENEYKADFIKRPFPIGFKQTRNWLAEIADVFNKSVRINEIIDKYKIYYQEGIKKLKLLLENKKLMIITYNHDIDWLIETIFDLNMKITKVCILNYSQDNIFRTDFKGKFKIEENYDPEKRKNDIEKLKPDLVLSNYTSSALGGSVCTDTIPLCPDVGFFSGLEIAKRWAGLISFDLKEGWKKDEKLFRKYYA
jgi:nitrogenase molybdenum-iron protein alpha/beta subunit